jgi:hypothetical protein
MAAIATIPTGTTIDRTFEAFFVRLKKKTIAKNANGRAFLPRRDDESCGEMSTEAQPGLKRVAPESRSSWRHHSAPCSPARGVTS